MENFPGRGNNKHQVGPRVGESLACWACCFGLFSAMEKIYDGIYTGHAWKEEKQGHTQCEWLAVNGS